VIDFIDMEENKNNRAVERKLKDCLKNDRARIQVGRISHFGLLEMSRQRIRTGVLESSTTPCPHCHGTGMIRSVESVALHVLRSLEDNLLKGATHNLIIRTTTEVALYILNQKRRNLSDLEARFAVDVEVQADEMVNGQLYVLERADPVDRDRIPQPVIPIVQPDTIDLDDDIVEPEVDEEEEVEAREQSEDGDRDRKRRRRRKRRRGGSENGSNESSEANTSSGDETSSEGDTEGGEEGDDAQRAEGGDEPRRKRRRGRRGGRRGRRNGDENGQLDENGEPIPAAEGEQTESAGTDVAASEAPVTPEETQSEDVSVAKAAEPAVESPEASSEEQAAAAPAQEAAAVKEEAAPATQEPEETSAEKVEISTPTPSNEPVEPVVTSERGSESEAETKPKRGGWWQRRSFF
ncbi:ribonuclease E/G, partial [Roseibium sp.]